MRVAVTGSTGLIGTAVCRALADRGDGPIPIVRPASKVSSPGIAWDPARDTIDAGALEGIDAVVHLAGESIAGGLWTAAPKRRIRESRIQPCSSRHRQWAFTGIAAMRCSQKTVHPAVGFLPKRAAFGRRRPHRPKRRVFASPTSVRDSW